MNIHTHTQERKNTTPNEMPFQTTAEMINWVSVLNHMYG